MTEFPAKPPRFVAPARRFAAYIFDCDGTLVESMPLHHQAWLIALRAGGANFEFDWQLFNQRAGMTLEQTVEELSAQFDCPLDAEQIAVHQRKAYQSLLDGVQPIDSVVQFARSLQGKAPLSVASGGRREEVEQSLHNVGIRSLFDWVVTSSDVTHGKPNPEMLLECAQRMNVAPKDCLVVEDGQLGIEAAERAGMQWVRVQVLEG